MEMQPLHMVTAVAEEPFMHPTRTIPRVLSLALIIVPLIYWLLHAQHPALGYELYLMSTDLMGSSSAISYASKCLVPFVLSAGAAGSAGGVELLARRAAKQHLPMSASIQWIGIIAGISQAIILSLVILPYPPIRNGIALLLYSALSVMPFLMYVACAGISMASTVMLSRFLQKRA